MNDYARIARVICYLDEHRVEQPNLARLAEQAGLSQFHFHRLFARWAGVAPKDFLRQERRPGHITSMVSTATFSSAPTHRWMK